MKKLLAIVISMAMVVAMMPMGVFGAVGQNDVAQIGDTGYATLQEAITAAENGDTIHVISDFTEAGQVVVPENKNITIDLGGKTITTMGDDKGIWSTINGNLTIQGEGYIGDATHNSVGYLFYLTGTLTLKGNITYESGLEVVQPSSENSKLYITDGYFIGGSYSNKYWTINKLDRYKDTALVEISGGEFEFFDPSNSKTENPEENWVKDGYCVKEETVNNKVIYKVIPRRELGDSEVAEINGQYFTSIAGAIAVASDGDTIKLVKDAITDKTLVVNKNIVLDLNSKKVSYEDGCTRTIIVGENSKLKIIGDGTIEGKQVVVQNNGTLIVENGVLDGQYSVFSISDTETTLNNGTYKGFIYTNGTYENSNITINNGEFEAQLYLAAKNSKYVINNGNYSTGNGSTIEIKGGTLDIKGGTFNNTGTEKTQVANFNGSSTSGYALAVVKNSSYGGAIVNVSGGVFLNDIALLYDTEPEDPKCLLSVTGGTFSSDPKEYVADGYVVTGNGPFTVGRPYTPSTPADNVTNNPTEKNTTADLTPAVSDNKSTTTVDNATADKIVDKAVANKSTEVIVDAKGNNTVASSEVAIPEKTVKEISEKTDANLVIKTDNGKVDLDKTALAAVAEQAGTTGTVRLVVETVKTDENICHVDLKLVTSNGDVKDFNGGIVTVTINLDKELAAKELVCVYINDNGIYTLVEGVLNADGTYTFTTGHFSEYAVMAKDEADKVIADQLKTMIKDVNLKVRTSKTTKKNIKAVVSGDVKALTDAGYTVKYKFYRSTKKASKYTAAKVKDTNTYINTTGKKGTKYYYKAKALVYDGDKLVGQTVLKQCKYGVRAWSK